MEAVAELPLTTQSMTRPANGPALPSAASNEKRREILLDALKAALADSAEHRLFRSGRLTGLFPSKLGDAGEAARQALAAGLLEHVRTDVRGKFIFEWVRATPRAVEFVAEHDSPKAILRELRDVLGDTRSGIPTWMDQARTELRTLAGLFEQRSSAILKRLESLAERVEATLRRAEAMPPRPVVGQSVAPWVDRAMAYLDRRSQGGLGPCSLAELFHAIRETFPDVGVPPFHDGIRRLAELRAVSLSAGDGEPAEPEFAIVHDGRLMQCVSR
jgi:hypothetical protein